MSDSAAALERYLAELRPRRVRYAVFISVVVLGLLAWVVVAYERGEAAHATLRTVSKAPPTLPAVQPAPGQQVSWRASDRLAIGAPQYQGTVITFDTHTVRGRDARTGRQTWSYTRTDRRVCAAAQIGGQTIAIYEHDGNCDELSSFSSGTGRRGWTRTLDKDGMPLNGRPAFQATAFTLMITSRTVIYAINPDNGYDLWTYTRYGCAIRAARLGTAGALISQDCSHPRCAGVKFCGRGVQLLLRDPGADRGDSGKPNADQIKWIRLGDGRAPVSADQVVSAIDPATGALVRYLAGSGRPSAPTTLTPAPTLSPSALSASSVLDTDDADIVWIGGVTYALGLQQETPLWARATPAPPTVISAKGDAIPDRATARVTAPSAGGAQLLAGVDGRVLADVTLPSAPSPSSGVYPLGSGFLAYNSKGMAAYG